jgi:predicted Rossmann fold flavoprotein
MSLDDPSFVVDVAVVGAGAAGLATAIFVARRCPSRTILALDGAKKLGAKILVSGGGRCNVTNVAVTPSDFCGGSPHVIRRVLAAFTAEQTVAFFRELGVELHVEEYGKLFPDSNRARTVLDALVREAERLGVRILPGHRVTQIERRDGCFEIGADIGGASSGGVRAFPARLVVLATGGLSLPKTGSDGGGYRLARHLGHSLTPTTPALVPLILDGDFHAGLSGIAHEVTLTVLVEGCKPVRVRGPLLWTHFGVSGPVVLDASRHWHHARLEQRGVTISVSFLPDDDFNSAEEKLLGLVSSQPKVFLRNALAAILPGRLAEELLKKLGIDGGVAMAQVTRDARRALVRTLLESPMAVRDSRGYGYAEVTAGGVPLNEIDPASMASRKCPGLYLVGEILDVDGRIGGFNFQWSWSSAWVAAAGIKRELTV